MAKNHPPQISALNGAPQILVLNSMKRPGNYLCQKELILIIAFHPDVRRVNYFINIFKRRLSLQSATDPLDAWRHHVGWLLYQMAYAQNESKQRNWEGTVKNTILTSIAVTALIICSNAHANYFHV